MASRVELPLESNETDSRPSVRVYVDGRGPFLFLLDTGAGCSQVSRSLARKVNAEYTQHRIIHSAAFGSRCDPARVAILHSLQLGSAEYRKVAVEVVDDEKLRFRGRQHDGVLGFELFMGSTLTLDFPKGRMVMDRPGGLPERDIDGYPSYPLRVVGNMPAMPIGIGWGEAQIKTIYAIIDTGGEAPLLLPESARSWSFAADPVGELSVKDAAGEHDVQALCLRTSILVGDRCFASPQVVYVKQPDNMAVVGMPCLRDATVTFDASRSRMSIRSRPGG